MKALSVLLLLALGLGAGWWRLTHPDGTLDDVRREAGVLGTRLQDGALAARDTTLATFDRLASSGDPKDVDTAAPADVDAVALAEPAEGPEPDGGSDGDAGDDAAIAAPADGTDAPLDVDPAVDPLVAVTAPDGAAGDLAARLAALESRLDEAPSSSTANVVRGRLTDAERRLDATAVREAATLERLETVDARLGRIAERLEASAIESTRRHDAAEARLESIDETLGTLAARDDSLAERLDTFGAALLDGADEPGDPARALPGGGDDVAPVAAGADADGESADTVPLDGDDAPSSASAADAADDDAGAVGGDADSAAGGDAEAQGGSGDGAGSEADADTDANTVADTESDANGGPDAEAGADASAAADGLAGEARADAPSAAAARPAGRRNDDRRIAARLDAIASRLDRRLAAMETRLSEGDATDARLDELARRVERLAAAPGAAPPPADSPASGASLDAAQAEIRTELAAIGSQVDEDTTSDAAPALGQALESTRERLAALEARVQALPAASDAADAAKETQDALEAQVRTLERRLEALPKGTDPAIVSSISEVREQVDALASQGFVTQEELRETQEGRNVEYKIYFDRNSTEIGEDAARVLDSFIAQEKNRTTGVSIFGFTDRQGSASYNQRLALERATNVRSYLIQNGLPYTKIRAMNGLGEDAVAAILPDEAEDAQQRVVVLYAEQP